MDWNFANLAPASLLGNLVQLLEWIQDDILTWGGNVDAANNGLTNSQFVVLNPNALVGATYTVTSASWASTGGGQITYGFSAGTFEIQPNQYVTISGATPTGYNLVMAAVISSTTTSIVVAAPSNPGAWSSGGSILVGGMNPASGMIQSDPSGNLWANSNGTYAGWTQQTTTSPNVSSATGTLPIAHGGTGLTSLPVSAGIIGTNGSQQLVSSALTGDVTSTGAATTVVKVNGASLPVSTAVLGTNSSGQIIAGSASGFGGFPVNQETATYTATAADFSNFKTITVASGSFTVTLVASGSQPANGQSITIINYGTGTVTVARNGQNINGGTSSLTLPAGSATAPISCEVTSDGTNYFASISGVQAGGTGVTSVGLSLPGIFSVSGSPVTTAGTLTATLATETANTVFSGPSSGSAAAPTFRAMVAADLPSTATQTIASGTAAMGTSAIASGAKATLVTVSASGVATTDVIDFTPNGDPTSTTGYSPSASGGLFIVAYPTSNNVNFYVVNNTASSITPGALTLNWKVRR